jgi:hypothetical protein
MGRTWGEYDEEKVGRKSGRNQEDFRENSGGGRQAEVRRMFWTLTTTSY